MDINTQNNLLFDDVARRIGCCTLYRYRPINPDEIDALEEGYLWFSSANDLNDPFEGCIKLKEVEQDTTMEISLNFNIRVNGGAPNRIRINLESLRSVIFGHRTSKEDIEKVKTALKKFPHIKYQQSCLSQNEYELIIE